MKLVINRCYGGFGLSKEAKAAFEERTQQEDVLEWKIPRDHPVLVNIVETLGREASDSTALLRVVEIPDGVLWEIEEYDGMEWVSEVHRVWY